MVVFWFLLALALLAAALILLRLDARQRGGAASRETPPAVGAGSVGEGARSDDDEVPPVTPPASGVDEPGEGQADESGTPQLAPFQRAAGPEDAETGPAEPGAVEPGGEAHASASPPSDPVEPEAGGPEGARPETHAGDHAAEPVADHAAEPTAQSAPRLLDRVRGFLPARRQNGRRPEQEVLPAVDPLADSPVVRWLEDREFEPTPTPAPEFRHGDFAGGLSALGTVSHGMFRGRRAIMGVTGGRTVLALRRDTASDVVLDLSRADVDAEPGFHDAGEVASLEARSSDYGRLDLIDRDRLTSAVGDVPADVRRIWGEGEWVAATIDGVDDPSTWDDVVVALHGMADVLAPFPPIGGRARALPLEIDPGSPGAAAGPDADPTVGMDGEVGTGTHGAAAPAPSSVATSVLLAADDIAGQTPGSVPAQATAAEGPDDEGPDEQPEPPQPEPRRAGHLRLVPERKIARDLADVPVVADRGDTEAEPGSDPVPVAGEAPVEAAGSGLGDRTAEHSVAEEPDPFAEIMEPSGPLPARGDVAADHLPARPPLSRPTRGAGQAYPEDASVPPLAAGVATGGSGIKPLGSEDDEDEIRTEVERFDAARIDGGSDLAPTSGRRHGSDPADAASGEDTGRLSVAELAAKMGAAPSGGHHRHRRVDPDGDPGPGGDPAGDGEPGTDGDSSEGAAHDSDDPHPVGRERPGVDPDVEQTARLQLPPDIRN